jgi:hypothetical protein
VTRHEKVLLALAVVLLASAWFLSSDTSAPAVGFVEGRVPWDMALWQFRHALAPSFAVVGLVCAVGILFLRAAHWQPRSEAAPGETKPEPSP